MIALVQPEIDRQFLCLTILRKIDIHTKDREETKNAAKLFCNLKNNGFLLEITNEVEEIQKRSLSGELALSTLYSGESMVIADRDK